MLLIAGTRRRGDAEISKRPIPNAQLVRSLIDSGVRIVSVRITSIALALVVVTAIAADAGQGDLQEPLPVALVITYADGRAVSTVIGSRPHRSWTPMFPRIASWQPPPGSLSPNAIQYASSRDGDDVRVKVSVLFGQPHQKEVQVDELVVRAGEPVRVTALRRFGIEPVRLSLSPVGSLALNPPVIANRTAGLTIEDVAPIAAAPPRYRITVMNRSAVPAAAFQIESFRGGRSSLSKREADPRAMPIVQPGDRYTLDLPISGAPVRDEQPISTDSLDTIVLTSVVWSDGTTEGEPRSAAQVLLSNVGRRAQLTQVIALLERAAVQAQRDSSAALGTFRHRVQTLSIDSNLHGQAAAVLNRLPAGVVSPPDFDAILRSGMQRVKDLVKQDLDAFAATAAGSGESAPRWLARTLADYRAWCARLERRCP